MEAGMRTSIKMAMAIGVVTVTLVWAVAPVAQAQYAQAQPRRSGPGNAPAAPPPGTTVVLQELIGTGRRTLVKTPEYKTSLPKSTARAKEWAQITVKFDTIPEWIDVLALEYHVLTMTKENGKRIYSLLRQTVEHVDVQEGRDKLSAVFIPPSAVTRFGPPAAVHVKALINGQVVAEIDDVEASVKPLPDDWWQNKTVLENESVTVRDGNLWRLSVTPFALVNPDDYEVMR
jgi:hypothetical protein